MVKATGLSNGNVSHFDHLKGAVLNHDNKSVYKSNANAGQSNGENLVGNSASKVSHSTEFCKDKLSSQFRNIKKLDLVQLFQSMIGFQSLSKTCSYDSSMESFTRFKETGDSTCHSAEPEMACDIPSAIRQDTEALDLRENITYIQEVLNECGRFSQKDVPILFTDHGKQTIRETLNDCGRLSQNDVPILSTDHGKQTIREALKDCGRLSENDVPKLSSDHSKQQLLIKEDEEAEAKPGLEISTGTFNKLKDGMDLYIKAEIPNESDNHNKVPSKSSSKLEVIPPKPLASKYKLNRFQSRPKAAGYRNKFAVAYLMQDSIIQNEKEQGVQNVSNVNKENKVSQVIEENKEPLKTYCETHPPLSSDSLDTTPFEPNVKSMKSKHSELHERLQPIPGFQELQKGVHTECQPSLCIQEHAVNETEESSEDSLTDSTESDSVTDDEDSSSESLAQNAHPLSKAKSGRSNVIENENLSLRHPPFAKVSTHLFHTRSHQQDQQKESGTVPLHSYKRNKAEYSSYTDSQDSGQKACGNGVEHDYERRMNNWQNEYQSWCARFQNPAMAHYPPFYGQSAASGLYDSSTSSFPYPYYNDPFGDWYPQYPDSHHEGSRSSHSGDLCRQFNEHFEIQNRYLKEMSRYVWNNRLKK